MKDFVFRTSLVSDFFALRDEGKDDEAENCKLETPEFMDFFSLVMKYIGFDLDSYYGVQTIWRPLSDVEIIADCFGLTVEQLYHLLDNHSVDDWIVAFDACNGEMGVVFRYL